MGQSNEKVSNNFPSFTKPPLKLNLYSIKLIIIAELHITIYVSLAKSNSYTKYKWSQSLTDFCKQYILLRYCFYYSRKYKKLDLRVGKLEKQVWLAKYLYFKELGR